MVLCKDVNISSCIYLVGFKFQVQQMVAQRIPQKVF